MASAGLPTVEYLSPTRFRVSFVLTLEQMLRYGYILDSSDVTQLLSEYQEAGTLNHGEIDAPEREPRMSDKCWARRQGTSDPRYTGLSYELDKAQGSANARRWLLRGTLNLRGTRREFVKKMLTDGTPFALRPRLVRNKAGEFYIYCWDMVDA